MKKILLKLGILSTAVLPLATVVSCSTSWTSWNPTDEGKTEFEYEKTNAPVSQWRVRRLSDGTLDPELLASWANDELDLNLINNQYELMAMVNHIVQLKTPDPIGEYWDSASDYVEMKTYLSQITKTKTFNLKFMDEVKEVEWDATLSIDEAIRGIDEFALELDSEAKELLKRQPVYVDEFGDILNMADVTLAGVEMIALPIVSSLMEYNVSIGLGMSKLVNLPLITYDAFKGLLTDLGNINSNIYNNDVVDEWIFGKDLDFSISYTNGAYDSFELSGSTNENAHIIKLMNALLLITQLN